MAEFYHGIVRQSSDKIICIENISFNGKTMPTFKIRLNSESQLSGQKTFFPCFDWLSTKDGEEIAIALKDGGKTGTFLANHSDSKVEIRWFRLKASHRYRGTTD